jgi:hypothetical protein
MTEERSPYTARREIMPQPVRVIPESLLAEVIVAISGMTALPAGMTVGDVTRLLAALQRLTEAK